MRKGARNVRTGAVWGESDGGRSQTRTSHTRISIPVDSSVDVLPSRLHDTLGVGLVDSNISLSQKGLMTRKCRGIATAGCLGVGIHYLHKESLNIYLLSPTKPITNIHSGYTVPTRTLHP